MIEKFKGLKKFKSALTSLGYYIGNPEHNGEFKLIKKIILKAFLTKLIFFYHQN